MNDSMYVLRVSVCLFRDTLPAEQGESLCGMRSQEVSGDLSDILSMLDGVGNMAHGMGFTLVNHESMRKHAGKQEVAPPVLPDWSKAPQWAQWWAVDSSGAAHWYRSQPSGTDSVEWIGGGKYERAGFVDLDGGHWYRSLTARPQAKQADGMAALFAAMGAMDCGSCK